MGGRRGHALKLYKKRFNKDVAKYSFGNRVCTDWNNLPESVVTAQGINSFKTRLDNYIGRMRGRV